MDVADTLSTMLVSVPRSPLRASPSAVNNHSEIAWKLSLEPGASRSLTYVFSYYVR